VSVSALSVALAALLAAALTGCDAERARAQSLTERASRLGDGRVLFSYAAREGICGDGRGNIRSIEGDYLELDGVWRDECQRGPVRVAVEVHGGRIADLDTYVGGRWTPRTDAVDMGTLEPAVAVRLLLDLARTDRGEGGEQAVFPATIARDVVVWPELLALARDEGVAGETREEAVFWLGHYAGEAVTGDLEELSADERMDLEVREAAVFALSEIDDGGGIESLLRIAREDGDPRIREKAMFWLADSGDPRALRLFEEILTGS
jgi:hypothetical protein